MPAQDRHYSHTGTMRRVPLCAPNPSQIDETDEERDARVQAHAARVATERPDALGSTERGRKLVDGRSRELAVAECLAALGPLGHDCLARVSGVASSTLYVVLRSPWFVRAGGLWTLTPAGRAALEAAR